MDFRRKVGSQLPCVLIYDGQAQFWKQDPWKTCNETKFEAECEERISSAANIKTKRRIDFWNSSCRRVMQNERKNRVQAEIF